MQSIHIPKNSDNPDKPEVIFDAETGVCEIKGESYMESTYTFYLPLMNWLDEYIKTVGKKVQLDIKLLYFNTSATKCLLDIFEILKKYKDQGGEVEINWYYDRDDPDMVHEIEDFETESGLQINIREY
ncbi:MAG: DUF1987 domain-containing protein [Bacteroidales bacterium]|nr:DUF1987 domain-containing protein [Bacteroidales bacterium]